MLNNSSVNIRTSALLRDFTVALGQQLYFWGCDIKHPDGNLLCQFGLERVKSQGHQGTSCYRMNYQGDIIELHGMCVGRYSIVDTSFLFTREPLRSCLYDSSKPPLPGHYKKELVNTRQVNQLASASRKFLEWWLEYENWIETKTDKNYRKQCYKQFRNFSNSRVWLPPDKSTKWLRCYLSSPESLQRAKEWKKL